MTEEEMIKAFDECLIGEYHNKDLEPILKEIYELFDFTFIIFLSWKFTIRDELKIDYIKRVFPLFYKIVETGNIDIFKNLINEFMHPKAGPCITTDLIIQTFDILIDPYEYFNRNVDDVYFESIIEYFIREKKYDFCLKNNNYLFFDYLSKYMYYCQTYNIKKNNYAIIAMYYFIKDKIDPEKYLHALDYVFGNYKELNTFTSLNYVSEKKVEYMDNLMNMIFNEIEFNNKEIK